MKNYSSVFLSFICALTLTLTTNTFAATVTGNLGVTALVGSGCQVNSGTVQSGNVNFGNLNFGSINTIGAANIDAQTTGSGNGSIIMECSNGTTFTITLDNGLHFGSGTRAMANAGNPAVLLNYALYQNVAHTVPWTVSSPLTGTASGAPVTFEVYGRVPGGQSGITSGTYNDTVQVVISW